MDIVLLSKSISASDRASSSPSRIPVQYRTSKHIYDIKAKDMITEYIKLQGYINRSTVQELCGFTDQQARRTIEKMKEENIIEMSNGGRYAKYILKEI